MKETLTREIFEHLVHLAALELAPEESEYLFKQLNYQMTAIQELEAVPLEEDEHITSHGVPFTPEISPEIRADEWRPYPEVDEILAQAPEIADRYIVVPDIPHQELD